MLYVKQCPKDAHHLFTELGFRIHSLKVVMTMSFSGGMEWMMKELQKKQYQYLRKEFKQLAESIDPVFYYGGII